MLPAICSFTESKLVLLALISPLLLLHFLPVSTSLLITGIIIYLFRLLWSDTDTSYPQSLRNQCVLITGCSSGIGLEAAVQIARLEPTLLIIGVRGTQRALYFAELIKMRSGNNLKTSILPLHLDLENEESIKEFAKKAVNCSGGMIDYLLLNAGSFSSNSIQVNALGHIQLVSLLREAQALKESRILLISSILYLLAGLLSTLR